MIVQSNDVGQIIDRLVRESSEHRLSALLDICSGAPSSIFWPVFMDQWPLCDDTWHLRKRLLLALSRNARVEPPTEYFSPEQRDFFSRLPPVLTVYRGCPRERSKGLSWTLMQEVAAGFARGHRGIRVSDPVVLKGTICKDQIFSVFTDRNEAEIVLDPRRLVSAGSCRP